jgi:hypothetical protein
MSFHLLVPCSVKSHASEIPRRDRSALTLCGIPTSLVQGKFVDDLRPMQEQADLQNRVAGFPLATVPCQKTADRLKRKKVADFSSTIPDWFWFDRLQPSH